MTVSSEMLRSISTPEQLDTRLRLYNPLQPFFDKSWRPSEIEEVA